jgi:hypothetical protein
LVSTITASRWLAGALLQEQVEHRQLPLAAMHAQPVDRLGFGLGTCHHMGIAHLVDDRGQLLPQCRVVFGEKYVHGAPFVHPVIRRDHF